MTGYAFATALAAPVDDGMMLAEAARPARQSLPFIVLSTTACEAVAAWTVVINPFDEGCKAVGRARSARDDLHAGLVVFRVDTDDNSGRLSVLVTSRNDNFLCSTIDVLQATLC